MSVRVCVRVRKGGVGCPKGEGCAQVSKREGGVRVQKGKNACPGVHVQKGRGACPKGWWVRVQKGRGVCVSKKGEKVCVGGRGVQRGSGSPKGRGGACPKGRVRVQKVVRVQRGRKCVSKKRLGVCVSNGTCVRVHVRVSQSVWGGGVSGGVCVSKGGRGGSACPKGECACPKMGVCVFKKGERGCACPKGEGSVRVQKREGGVRAQKEGEVRVPKGRGRVRVQKGRVRVACPKVGWCVSKRGRVGCACPKGRGGVRVQKEEGECACPRGGGRCVSKKGEGGLRVQKKRGGCACPKGEGVCVSKKKGREVCVSKKGEGGVRVQKGRGRCASKRGGERCASKRKGCASKMEGGGGRGCARPKGEGKCANIGAAQFGHVKVALQHIHGDASFAGHPNGNPKPRASCTMVATNRVGSHTGSQSLWSTMWKSSSQSPTYCYD